MRAPRARPERVVVAQPTRQRPVSAPAKSTVSSTGAHLVVRDRVARAFTAGVDRERDADHFAAAR